MTSSRCLSAAAALLLSASVAGAAGVDFKDPRRALGREENIRIDAELVQDTVAAGSPIAVTYQVENLTQSAIAVADKVADASFDADSQTITLSIGAEIPQGTSMPHLVTIPPGQTRAFSTAATVQAVVPKARTPWARVPRFVQIRVNVLRDLKPFASLIDQQSRSAAAPPLPNSMFDIWVDSVSSVMLNALPVHWSDASRSAGVEADQPGIGR